jgi:hypothetical protein
MKRTIVVLAAVSVTCGLIVPLSSGQNCDKVDGFMHTKLVHAQKVLEGLTLEDYEAIAKHGQELALLSQAASWQVIQTAQYHQHSGEFRNAATSLVDAARKKDLDAAALAYVAMTLKCVNCHKYVRRIQTAHVDAPLETWLAADRPVREPRR